MPNRIKFDRRRPLPSWAKFVGRPSSFGNPFPVADFRGDHAAAVARYREWLDDVEAPPVRCGGKLYHRPSAAKIRQHLRGYKLACWCPLDEPCHADLLLELAN